MKPMRPIKDLKIRKTRPSDASEATNRNRKAMGSFDNRTPVDLPIQAFGIPFFVFKRWFGIEPSSSALFELVGLFARVLRRVARNRALPAPAER